MKLSYLLGFYPAITIIALSWVSYTKPRPWADSFASRTGWLRLSVLSMMVGLAAGLGLYVATLHFHDLLWSLALEMVAGLLAMTATFSVFTDFKVHRLDARILGLSSLFSFSLTLPLMIVHHNWEAVITCGAIFAFFGLGYVLVMSIGESDIFAGMFVSVAIIPIAGYFGFMWGVIGIGAVGLLFAIALTINRGSIWVRMPLAPIILISFLVVAILSPYVVFSPIRIA